MKGYKAFNADMTCRGFQYEIGKTYKMEGRIEICERGFHFCESLIECFAYYFFMPETRIAEVEAIGKVIEGDNKCVTNVIKIVRELSWDEVLEQLETEEQK